MNIDIDGPQINECTKWHSDGFKCVSADDCVDGYFDNSGGVPAIRGDDDDYVDVDEVSFSLSNADIFWSHSGILRNTI